MTKKIHLILIASLILFSSACKKDSSNNPIIPGINTSMSAKIDGNEWSTIIRSCTKNANTIVLNGVSLDGKIIEINISPNIATEVLSINKDYTIPITSFYKKQATISTNDIYFSTNGTVRLSLMDQTNKLISGTFSFSAMSISFGVASITNGSFTNISYVGD